MLRALTVLLAYQLVGELAVRVGGLPLPGPVLGMVLLFLTLAARGRPPPAVLGDTADGLLSHLSLLFVPAGVGVMLHFAGLQGQYVALAAAIVLSSIITIAVTALVMQMVHRFASRRDAGRPPP